MPFTIKLRILGFNPKGPRFNWGLIRVIVSPTPAINENAKSLPSSMP